MTSKSKTTTMNTIHTLTKYYSSGKVETLTTGSLQDCQSELNQYKYLARKNGADIESEDETSMVCIDYAGNGVDVTFDIIDTQEELF
jgi:hypothetical protein